MFSSLQPGMRASSLLALLLAWCAATALPQERDTPTCPKTSVLILGAGTAGIAAAKALSDAGVSDFLILEYNDYIGGRVVQTTFGSKPDGKPYIVELGANWIQGLQSPGGPASPIWSLSQEFNITNTYSNYSSILTYDQTGYVDYSALLDDYEDAYGEFEQDAGYILTENLLDINVEAGLALAGWTPGNDPHAEAVDWWEWDWEFGGPPQESSQLFGVVNYNTTFYQFSDANNYVYDERGYNTFIRGLASTYLAPNDARLLLNTIVTNITHSPSGVTVHTRNGTCFTASYAICTFSLGVLQASLSITTPGPVTFSPPFPRWKSQAIATFAMTIYTKIFLQFPTQFWPDDTQFFLYASPTTRGYYPVWQSLSTDGFLPGSNILFVTVVTTESKRIEAQDDAVTKAEVLAVLQQMFPHVTIPTPTAFMYPRWGRAEWAYGAYSNWPIGVTLKQHQNLRTNLGRLYFAGEATSAEYFGFLQGAYFEGMKAGADIAACVSSGMNHTLCDGEKKYASLKGTTLGGQYDEVNGWDVTSFQTWGFD